MQTAQKRKLVIALILAIMALGGFFRLHDLSRSAFRADTILVYELARRQTPPAQILSKWFEVSGAAGQMPMPAFLMQSFLNTLHLDPTPANVRMPFALIGMVTVLVAYFAGRRFRGPWFGVLLMAWVAIHPFSVYFSREAYFYSSALLGYFFYFWASVAIVEKLLANERLGWPEGLVLAAGIFFSCYSQMTGFFVCVAGALLFFGLVLIRRLKHAVWKVNLAILAVVHGLLFAPFLAVPWGPREMLANRQNAKFQEDSNRLVEITGDTLMGGVSMAATRLGWGTTALAILLLVLAFGFGVYRLYRERDWKIALLAYFIGAQVLLYALARELMGAVSEPRYLGGAWPFYLAFLGCGLIAFAHVLAGRIGKSQRAGVIAGIVLVIALCFFMYPAYLVTQLTGKPTPCYDVVSAVDKNLPTGTPVLVDRWFEPWNELRTHPSTNVHFTFTIPNEPVSTYIQSRWRESAQRFFLQFPDAAYLEIAKSYWSVPEVGSWDWPRSFFAQHIVITNTAALKLRDMGLVTRGDFYDENDSRTVVELFYNTRDDVLHKYKAAGRELVVLFGPGWSYTKLWRQMRDFRDWRVLTREAYVEVYNLGTEPVDVKLGIQGVAVNGIKKVQINEGQGTEFPNSGMVMWQVQLPQLPPGGRRLKLTDPLWHGKNQVPLLVQTMVLEEIPKAAAPTPPSS